MRVTLVSPYDPAPAACEEDRKHVGGVERVFLDVSGQLARRGHDVTLLCSTDGPSGVAERGGVHVVRRHRAGALLGAPLVRLAKHVPPDSDVVHVAATYPFTTPAVLRRAHKLRIPSVLDFHFEPHPASRLGRLAAAVYRGVGPPSYRFADAALVRSFSYGRSAASLASVPEGRWHVVPNGIDPQRFHPDGNVGRGDYILFVGRLVPYKGLDVLLHALARQPDAPPLVIAGEGPCERALRTLAQRLGVAVTFLGRVPDDDLPSLYSRARVTVLPSVAKQEAFGLSLLESMACGTPVVASDLPGVDEVALLGGLLARPGDPVSLSDQLRRVDDPTLLVRGPALAARIHGAFAWDVITDRLMKVYNDVLDEPVTRVGGVTRIAHPRGDPVL